MVQLKVLTPAHVRRQHISSVPLLPTHTHTHTQHTHTHTHTQRHTHTQTRTHAHTRTHTHTQTQTQKHQFRSKLKAGWCGVVWCGVVWCGVCSQCRRSHNAHYALCVGHQLLRGHQKNRQLKNHHSYNNYNADIIRSEE